MSELKIIKMSDVKPMTEDERRDFLAAKRKEYLQSLRELCPSAEVRKEARKIAKRKVPCGSCVYYDGQTEYCWYPKSDMVIEDLKINPCYEGIIRYLVKNIHPCEEMASLVKAPDCLKRLFYDDSKVVCNLADMFLSYTGDNTPDSAIKAVRGLYDATQRYMEIFAKTFGIEDDKPPVPLSDL